MCVAGAVVHVSNRHNECCVVQIMYYNAHYKSVLMRGLVL